MSPTNKGKGIYKCCEVTCSKIFTLIQNCSKHEKKFKHAPVTRRSSISLPQYNPDAKRYHIPMSSSKSNSKYIRSITRHIKEGCTLIRKESVKNDRTCNYCGMTFGRRSNLDTHLKTNHSNTLFPISSMDASPQENVARNVDERNNGSEILDVPFISDDGNFIDMNITMIDKGTYFIYYFKKVQVT